MDKITLNNYFQGIASKQEEEFILAWVESSEENRKAFQKERMLYDIALFHNTKQKKKKTSKVYSILGWTAGVAASIIIIVGSVQFVREQQYEKELQMQSVTVPPGQRARIMLADGTKIWLNAKSTLKYPAQFGKKNRNVELDGEAFFEVTKNIHKPFSVYTEKNKIEVVGTSFNVSAYKGSGEFEAILIEGTVDIYSTLSDKPLTRLNKDEVFSSNQDKTTKKKVDSNDQLKWKEGLYCFDDTEFKQFLDKLEKYYNVKFVVENTDVLDYQVTGKFREGDGVEHILKTIQRDHKFIYTIAAGSDTIRIR